MPNRCKLQSLLAVSVTVPVFINTENLIKWRTDLQNKTPKFISYTIVCETFQTWIVFGMLITSHSMACSCIEKLVSAEAALPE